MRCTITGSTMRAEPRGWERNDSSALLRIEEANLRLVDLAPTDGYTKRGWL